MDVARISGLGGALIPESGNDRHKDMKDEEDEREVLAVGPLAEEEKPASENTSTPGDAPRSHEEKPRRARKSTRSSTVSVDSVDSRGSKSRSPSRGKASNAFSTFANAIGMGTTFANGTTFSSKYNGADDDANVERTFSSARLRRKSLAPKGEIVDIPDACDPLPMHYFEIDEPMQLSKTEPGKPAYGFTRSARKSIMLGLGLSGADSFFAETGESSSALIDPYTKASDRTCLENYMGVVIGFGVVALPSVFSDCGWLLGVIAICTFGGLNTFWVCRLIEVPILLRSNLEKYGDVAKACFGNSILQGAAIFTISLSWYGQVILAYYNILYYSLHHRVVKRSDLWGFLMELAIILILLPFTFRTTIKVLTKNVRIGLKAMWLNLFVVLVCSIVRGAMNWKDIEYKAINYEPPKLIRGLQNICVAFSGIGILPYIVAEMLHPEHARKVMTEASWKITFFLLLYASVGYFGWGEHVNTSVAKSVEREKDGYAYAAICIDGLIIVRCVASYPIYFLPLFREMEGYLQLEGSPPVTLGLPWAILRQARHKTVMKLVIIGSSVAVYRCCPDYHLFLNIMNIPNFVAQLVLPPVFSILAVRTYHSKYASDKYPVDKRIFGTSCWQVCVTMTLAAVSFASGTFLLGGNVDLLVKYFQHGVSVYKQQ